MGISYLLSKMCGTNCNSAKAWCDDDRCLKQATCPPDWDYRPYVPVFTILKEMYDEEKERQTRARRPWRVLDGFDDDDDSEDDEDDQQQPVEADDKIDALEPAEEETDEEAGDGQRS